MRAKTLKGLVHLALAALAAYEARESQTNARRIVNGAACGWHLYASYDHFFIEEDPEENS